MIDRYYGHLARDGREHAIRLLDALNGHGGERWTLGRSVDVEPANRRQETAAKQAKIRSLLADSNRRPLLTIRACVVRPGEGAVRVRRWRADTVRRPGLCRRD
jgi:hypothetical protein